MAVIAEALDTFGAKDAISLVSKIHTVNSFEKLLKFLFYFSTIFMVSGYFFCRIHKIQVL